MNTLLVIDDESLILDSFRHIFAGEELTLATARSGGEGLSQFVEQRPDAVFLDVHLPDMSGLELFRRLQELDPRVPVILMTGHGSAATAIEAMRLGAYEYLLKPVNVDQITGLAARALEVSRLRRVPAKVADAEPGDDASDLLVGQCPAMQEVYKAIGRIAPQDVTVLILGESGTGKELVARAIYHYSKRVDKPFLAINCAAIPENLLESELFGHEKGAFTGADRKRVGKFEQCNGGTLFLDEVGDMTPLTQVKLLRVLQERQFEAVGGSQTLSADVRLIAATNRDLPEMAGSGTFRRDLFYRLNVCTIHLPPLRERGQDVVLLAQHFLRRFARELGKDVQEISADALGLLCRYPWPGNVRELQSAIKQALLRTAGHVLPPEALPVALRAGAGDARLPASKDFPDLCPYVRGRLEVGASGLHAEIVAQAERQLLEEVLRHTGGNLSQTAKLLGITRVTLRAKLASLGLTAGRAGDG
ncbi:MAG TPA: sigma-54 dependent transcriptional regulator [Gemmataceae bacterium]|nr:sigma-54 dependent transcriptional regulator [Gemmataceae bacterium]